MAERCWPAFNAPSVPSKVDQARPAESPQQKPTQVLSLSLSAPVSVWSVRAGRGVEGAKAGASAMRCSGDSTGTRWRWRGTSTALRVGLLWGELQTRRGRRAQHWRRVARVAQRARVRSGVPGAAGYSLVTGVRARHRARWDLLGDGGERAEIRDVN